jgi:CRISPR-associated protein Csb1
MLFIDMAKGFSLCYLEQGFKLMFDLECLIHSIDEHAAIRRRRRLQPAGGVGDKIFPPTYPGARNNDPPQHVFELRRVPDRVDPVACVLIDSVQSQANRAEDALQYAADEQAFDLPRIVVDFAGAGLTDLGRISSLDAPHRVFDAILRDSLLDGVTFMKSDLGKRLQLAKTTDATAIFEASPTALLFGVWNSTGEGGGLGAKFPRCLVSEIWGIDAPVETNERGVVQTAGRRTGSRIDPLGILRKTGDYIVKSEDGWSFKAEPSAKDKKQRPSEINHGNIAPSVQALGVTVAYVEQVSVLSFAGLRRLRFGDAARTQAARAVIAALGLLALLERDRQGFALRSRCDLVGDGPAPFELVNADGAAEALDVDLAGARALYGSAVEAARAAGFTYAAAPIVLQPQVKLVELVEKSRELALAGAGGEGEESSE